MGNYTTHWQVFWGKQKKQRPSKHIGQVFPIHIDINADSNPVIYLNVPSDPAIIILAVKMLHFLPFIQNFIFFVSTYFMQSLSLKTYKRMFKNFMKSTVMY